MNYYNEIDPNAAQWLRDLICEGLIPKGDVDERSIVDVRPADLRGYVQCHFFAGIGGWPYALRLAGWPENRPVWTGSCPCQPFSQAGKQRGKADERHLWPVWFGLIKECGPATCFGEQVEAAIGHGWLDGVFADMEGEGYACGAAVIGAHSAGAPHKRQRLYFVAHAEHDGHLAAKRHGDIHGIQQQAGRPAQSTGGIESATGGGDACCKLAYSKHQGCDDRRDHFGRLRANPGAAGGMGHPASGGHQQQSLCRQPREKHEAPSGVEPFRRLGTPNASFGPMEDTDSLQPKQSAWHGPRPGETQGAGPYGQSPRSNKAGLWTDAEWLPCRDGKHRAIESGTFPLAHGLPRSVGAMPEELQALAGVAGLDGASLKAAKSYRIGSLRGYGNAIVPQAAAGFIIAYLEIAN